MNIRELFGNKRILVALALIAVSIPVIAEIAVTCEDAALLYNTSGANWVTYCCGVADWVCPEDFQAGPGGDNVICEPERDIDCCVCHDTTPDICETSIYKNKHCDPGCAVPGDGAPRGEGWGSCVACEDYPCPSGSDEDCPYNCVCVNFQCTGAGEICSDGIDNDGDGLIDCLDPDCCSDPACPAYASNEGANGGVCCANSLDDDGDGLIDGEDPDCGGPPPGPDGECHFEFCESDPGCIIGCVGPCEDPSLLCCPAGSWTCACMESCSLAYDGTFNSMRKTGSIDIFDIQFGDASFVPDSEAPIDWRFYADEDDYGGTSCLQKATFDKTEPMPENDGQRHPVTTLTLQTVPGEYCAVQVHAIAPDGVTEVLGYYILDNGELPTINPNVQLPELPASMHPTAIYSDSRIDAESAFSGASAAVNSLSSACSGCVGLPRSKLDESWANLAAAQRYLDSCPPAGGGIPCRLSQYYSARALTLANEGLSIL